MEQPDVPRNSSMPLRAGISMAKAWRRVKLCAEDPSGLTAGPEYRHRLDGRSRSKTGPSGTMPFGLMVPWRTAQEIGLINQRDYADLVVKLGGRRHGHLRLTADTMLAVVLEDSKNGSKNFEAIVSFIGTQDADVRSHIGVSTQFLNILWQELGKFDLRCMQATSALLRNLIRYRAEDWALVLLFLKMNSAADVRRYVNGWIVGHFLPGGKIAEATRDIEDRARKLRAKRAKDVGNKSVLVPMRRKKHRRK